MLDTSLSRICSAAFLSRLFRGFVFTFMALYLIDVGFDGLQTGFLIGIAAISTLFISLPIGIINDRLDIRYTIAIGHVAVFVFLISVGLMNDFWLYVPLFFIGGSGISMIEVSYRNYVFKDREPWHEGRKYGLFTLTDEFSFFVGTILGMFMVSVMGFPSALVILGIYHIVLVPILFLLEPVSIAKTKLVQYERDFFHTNNILLAVILFLFATHWGAESTSYSLFLREVLGLDSLGMGMYVAFAILFLGIAAFFFGKKMDHMTDYHKIFLIGLLASGVTHVLMTVPDVWLSFAFRVVHEIGDGLAGVALLFWLGRKFKRTRLGGDSGIFFIVMTLGGFASAVIYGPVGFAMGYSIPLVLSGITTMVCAGLFIILKRRLD